MQTSLTELPDSRVRVEVEVPAEDVERATSRAARAMAQEMRMPGFRKGKAPPSLVIQRLGFGAGPRGGDPRGAARVVRTGAARRRGQPDRRPQHRDGLDPRERGRAARASSSRSACGRRPKLGEYKGLEVGRAETEVPDDIVDTEVERIREGFARLEPVERAAAEGDSLLIDFEGLIDGTAFEGGKADDYLLALGSGQLIEGFEEQLTGAKAGRGASRSRSPSPTTTRPSTWPAKTRSSRSRSRRCGRRSCPSSTTTSPPTPPSSTRSRSCAPTSARKSARRWTAGPRKTSGSPPIDAAVDAATVEVPDDLVTARATERWERMERQLAQRGMDPNAFLQMQGKTREELIEESKPDAERELKREAVVTAIAEAEEIEVTDEELVEALEHSAEHERTTPEKLLERLRENGRDAMIGEDIRARKAIELVAESAKPIPLEQAEAREKIWTPEKEREEPASSGRRSRVAALRGG